MPVGRVCQEDHMTLERHIGKFGRVVCEEWFARVMAMDIGLPESYPFMLQIEYRTE